MKAISPFVRFVRRSRKSDGQAEQGMNRRNPYSLKLRWLKAEVVHGGNFTRFSITLDITGYA